MRAADLDKIIDDYDSISFLDLLNQFTVRSQKLGTRVKESSGRITGQVRQKGGQIKDMAIRQRNRVVKDQRVERVARDFRRHVKSLDERFSSSTMVTKTEKVWFAFSLVQIFYFGVIMAAFPEWVHVVYTAELAVLLPIRIYTYHKREYQYYLADLCYYVNLMAIIYIWVLPDSTWLWTSCYAFSFGTLSFAIITWRNSLVLHSVEKTTSTFIHILPPVVFHTINFRLPADYQRKRFPAVSHVESWQTLRSLFYTTIAYFVWQLLYHYFITIRGKDKIKAGRMTSFEYLRKRNANTPLGKFVNGLPGPFPVIAFTFIQFGYQISTMSFLPIWYRYEYLSSIFLTVIFAVASYNGATYYIDVFGRRFLKELRTLQAELDQATEELKAERSKDSPSGVLSPATRSSSMSSISEAEPLSLSSSAHGSTTSFTVGSPEMRPDDKQPQK